MDQGEISKTFKGIKVGTSICVETMEGITFEGIVCAKFSKKEEPDEIRFYGNTEFMCRLFGDTGADKKWAFFQGVHAPLYITKVSVPK